MIYPFYLRVLEVIYIRGEFHGQLSFHKLLHPRNTHLSQFFSIVTQTSQNGFHLELHLYLLKTYLFLLYYAHASHRYQRMQSSSTSTNTGEMFSA